MEYVVTSPEGKEFVVTAPEGATQEQALEFAKSQFGSTSGGAATGNPNLQAQGTRSLQNNATNLGRIAGEIGGATAIGGALGAAAPELLQGAGRLAGGFPATRGLAPWLESAGTLLKGRRGVSATQGAVSGAASETAGQAVEAVGGGPVMAEGARVVAGGLTPELLTGGKEMLRRYVMTPALSLTSKVKKEAARELLAKIEGNPAALSDQDRKFFDELVGELHGSTRPGEPQKEVYDALKASGAKGEYAASRFSGAADRGLSAAQSANIGGAQAREYGDIGSDLRSTIVKRNELMMSARKKQYAQNEESRDKIVAMREGAGDFIEKMPEYGSLVKELEGRLLKTREARLASPTLQVSDQGTERGLQSVLDAVNSRRVMISESEAEASIAKGFKVVKGTNPATGEPAVYREFPNSFQALDDVRRRLGEVFRGKPDEGYAAIGATNARDLYGKISEIQKKYAGGPGGPQEKLLDDYAASTEGLEIFRSAKGRKATALDKYKDDQFATDAAALPKTYFKNSASIRALEELVGDPKQVNQAAMEFANKELAGADAAKARTWLSKNTEWLRELPQVRLAVARHAASLEAAERTAGAAAVTTKAAAARNQQLVGNSFPVERVKELIESGNVELWKQAGPAIAASPQARAAIGDAVRQTLANRAGTSTKGLTELFESSIRPALENSRLMASAELNNIAGHLAAIERMQISEAQKLGIMNRIILQTVAGYTSSVAARTPGAVIDLGKAARDRMIPQ